MNLILLACGSSSSTDGSPSSLGDSDREVITCEESKWKPSIKSTEDSTQKFSTKVIYGEDDRLDLHEVCNDSYLEMAKSTVALIHSSITSDTETGIQVYSTTFGSSYDLCDEEPFYEQPIAPFCSGFLIAPNKIVTAGHCVTSQMECEEILFVFDYSLHSADSDLNMFPNDNIYSCQELIHRDSQTIGADFAIIELDRDVARRKPLPLRKSGEISVGNPLMVIGHPSGLPTKISSGASVQSLNESYFTADLDTYGGSSGSPIINKESKLVEGILSRGEVDYVWNNEGQCNMSNHCGDNDTCSGEDVTKISEILEYIPEVDNTSNRTE